MITCSFCEKAQRDVLKLVTTADRSAVICDECALLVVDIMIEGPTEKDGSLEKILGGEECHGTDS